MMFHSDTNLELIPVRNAIWKKIFSNLCCRSLEGLYTPSDRCCIFLALVAHLPNTQASCYFKLSVKIWESTKTIFFDISIPI